MNTSNSELKLLPMLSGAKLLSALEIRPTYDPKIKFQDAATRLIALSDIYTLYIPSQMSVEIYSKLYLALLRSLQKKHTTLSIRQQNQNFRAIHQQEYTGIIGGADCFTIIGCSGIGKSTAISRAITVITQSKIIETNNPYSKIIPCLIVQCPFDCSVKGLLLEILRKVDDLLDSKYYATAVRARATTDMLIGSVSQVALNHIGLLIVDEIQNVVNSKHGNSLIGMLTQLINSSGISICMVGTPESAVFFEQAMQLARRSLGIQYSNMECNCYFQDFCNILFSYQYVQKEAESTDLITEWLYQHSAGIISVVVSLVHDAQEIAILDGSETLNMESLTKAYQQRMSLLHGYIEPIIKRKPQTASAKTRSNMFSNTAISIDNPNLLSELAALAKAQQLDIVNLLNEHIPITEVVT